jgi:hypothetical protein
MLVLIIIIINNNNYNNNGSTAHCWAFAAFSVFFYTQLVGLFGQRISPSQGCHPHRGNHNMG